MLLRAHRQQPSTLTRREDAELVAFRVGHDDPGLLALTDVHLLRAQAFQSDDFSILIIRNEIEVQAILDRLGFRREKKEHGWPDSAWIAQFDPFIVLRCDLPTKRLRPPPAERARVLRVDGDLFPCESHARQFSGELSDHPGFAECAHYFS